MKNYQAALKFTALILSAGILFSSGCTQRAVPRNDQQRTGIQGELAPDRNNPMDNNMPSITSENTGANPQIVQPQQLQQTQQADMTSYKQKADNICAQLVKMNEVETANAVVIGNTCIVGYKPSKNSANTDTTKNLIINKVKSLDRTIDNVVVTESGDEIERIKKLYNDIANNKPAGQINNDFMQLLKSIGP